MAETAPPIAAKAVERSLSERTKMYDVDGDGQLGKLELVRVAPYLIPGDLLLTYLS